MCVRRHRLEITANTIQQIGQSRRVESLHLVGLLARLAARVVESRLQLADALASRFEPGTEVGNDLAPSFGKVDFQFTKMEKAPLLASSRTFRKYGQSGIEISDLFEHTAQFADDMAVIRPAITTGSRMLSGRTG